jgi:uncharacterized membrane protein
MTQRAQLWESLTGAGIVHGPLPAEAGDHSPWYVRAMLGVAAWLAAVFLLAFLGIALSTALRNTTAAIVIGAVICGAAIVVLRMVPANVFVAQLAVASSLAGQGLIVFGLLDHGGWRGAGPWLAIAALEVVLVALAPEYLHRVLSTLAAAVAMRMVLGALGWAALFPALLAAVFVATQGNEPPLLKRSALWTPVATGLVLTLLFLVPATLVWNELGGFRRAAQLIALPPWLGTAALAAVFVAAVGKLLRDARVAWTSPTGTYALLAALAVVLVAWPIPGVIVALLVLLLAFAAGQHVLMGLAILALLFALGHYYYSLQSTLLVKAAALFATGILLIAARFLVRVVVPRAPEAGHA